MTKKASDIGSALTKKGFTEDSSRDHKYYYFWHENKKTQIYTKVSHSARDVADKLFSVMGRQVRLTTGQFAELVDCEIDGTTYSKLMVQQGHVTPTPGDPPVQKSRPRSKSN